MLSFTVVERCDCLLSACLPACLCVCLFSVCLSACLSACMSVFCLSVSLPVCCAISVCLSVCLFVCQAGYQVTFLRSMAKHLSNHTASYLFKRNVNLSHRDISTCSAGYKHSLYAGTLRHCLIHHSFQITGFPAAHYLVGSDDCFSICYNMTFNKITHCQAVNFIF